MAAAGGDTIVPTNWPGLIITALIVAGIAAATYFGLDMTSSGEEKATQKGDTSIQEVFSANSRREIAAAAPARVITRADLAAEDTPAEEPAVEEASSSTPETDEEVADDDAWSGAQWEEPAEEPETSEETASEEAVAEESTSEESSDRAEAAKPTPAKAAATAQEEPEPEVRAQRQRPSAEALIAWWKTGASNDELSVRFAGTFDKGDQVSDAIAVMFSDTVAPQNANQYIQVTDSAGNAVSGQWQAAANPRLLTLSGLAVGRYSMKINAALSSTSGKALGEELGGPVFVY